MQTKKLRLLILLEMLLGVVLLLSPLVFFKQHGPCGTAWPHPVDITIHGGFIAGKQYDDVMLPLASFQLVIILLCIGIVALTLIKDMRGELRVTIQSIVLTLLIFFLPSLSQYITAVYGNSDGCSLTMHYQWGLAIYFIIVIIHLVVLFYEFKVISQKRKAI